MQSREQLVEELEALRLRVRELEEGNRELARSERGVRVELERMSRSMQAAGVGAWNWSRHTNVVTWSDENYRVLGREPGGVEARYENWICRVNPADRAGLERGPGLAILVHGLPAVGRGWPLSRRSQSAQSPLSEKLMASKGASRTASSSFRVASRIHRPPWFS